MNHNSKTTPIRSAALASGIALILGACGSSAPTPQLVDARRTYNEASASEAARLTPDKLLSAQQALEQAEAAHNDDPGSAKEAHLGYLAARRSAMAIAYGKIAAAKETEEQAEARYQESLRERATSSESELSNTQSALDEERRRREEAEQRSASALRSLAEIAKVNEESRGTVITLPGGVLFASGGHALSAPARRALDRVASALTEQPVGSRIVVEGHTDARGSDERNQTLSQQRADAVREYLVQKGVQAQNVQAMGRGESSPIADNDTSEGRATNRRVEIVVSNAGAASSTGSAGPITPRTQTIPTPSESRVPASPNTPKTPAAATPSAPPSAVSPGGMNKPQHPHE